METCIFFSGWIFRAFLLTEVPRALHKRVWFACLISIIAIVFSQLDSVVVQALKSGRWKVHGNICSVKKISLLLALTSEIHRPEDKYWQPGCCPFVVWTFESWKNVLTHSCRCVRREIRPYQDWGNHCVWKGRSKIWDSLCCVLRLILLSTLNPVVYLVLYRVT